MHIIRTFSIMRVLGVRLFVITKVRNYGKIVLFKNMFENDWSEGCIPTSLLDAPLPAPITMSLITMATNRFGFSMMWGKFCHSCFETTARTALAQFGHLTLKTRVRFQKGWGVRPPNPPGGTTAYRINSDVVNHYPKRPAKCLV